MSSPDPEHLFAQADSLTAARGAPRQADLRRAISAAYYGVFHFTLTAAADMVAGAGSRSTSLYSLAYRSVDHARLRTLCRQLSEPRIPRDLLSYARTDGFGRIVDFAEVVAQLHELRSLADYDPSRRFLLDDARTAVADAREAIKSFEAANTEQRRAFLTLLLFKPR
jgi:NAD(P)-dependent dehydrogenase (short-subunit alcohol dehydrogenase family)